MIDNSYINSVDNIIKTTTDNPESLAIESSNSKTSEIETNELFRNIGNDAMDFNIVSQDECSPNFAQYLAQQTIHVRKFKLKK